MTIQIESPIGEQALTEFILFYDNVYEYRSARWPALLPFQLPVLMGESPGAKGHRMHPLVAREDGEIVARALAVVDERYLQRWDEPLGHATMFEAMPGAVAATKAMMDAAADWLRSQGMQAVRAGFGMGPEFPFAVDDYESLPPNMARQNPSYYHRFLKDAGFESEQGWVDYKIEVTPQLVTRYEEALAAAEKGGFDIVALKDVPADRAPSQFIETWNEAFLKHWGATDFLEEEFALLAQALEPYGMNDASAIAYRGDEPVGVIWVVPDVTSIAVLAPGRELHDSEKLNTLGIGVLEQARGRGVNLALASFSFLELIRRGAKYLSYTLVLDDNWPSRRTAEKLGAQVCANYMVYRRNFKRAH